MERKVTRASTASTETWRARAKAENLTPVYNIEISRPSVVASGVEDLTREPEHKERFKALPKTATKGKRSK
jgi:hypothetical protein